MTVENANTKVISPTNQNKSKRRAMNQSESLAIVRNSLKAREESRVQGAIVLVLLLIFEKIGARFLSVAIAITLLLLKVH